MRKHNKRWWYKVNVNPGYRVIVEDECLLSLVCSLKDKKVYQTAYFQKAQEGV